jgi:uncharacterized SAM-binding protein YcdF (DUF218 family)
MSGEQIIIAIEVVGTLLAILWVCRRWRVERRSLWLGVSFIVAIGFLLATTETVLLYLGLGAGVAAASAIAIGLGAIVFVIALLFPLVVVVAFFATGIRLIRREGFSLAHVLSLAVGILYVLYLVVWPLAGDMWHERVAGVIYAYLTFVMLFTAATLMVYTVTAALNLIKRPKIHYSYIIVLGCGLAADGSVTNLLAGRVKRGIEAWRENFESILIMSGGKGDDEIRAEAEAMREYAIGLGVKSDAILTEARSRSTEENLRYSYKIISSLQAKQKEAEPAGKILVVTDNYHVLRALLLAKSLEIPCDGRGSHPKLYFALNALVREWVAFLFIWKKTYLKVIIGGAIVVAISNLIMFLYAL